MRPRLITAENGVLLAVVRDDHASMRPRLITAENEDLLLDGAESHKLQ